ncbi:MAG TPA: PQQ-binding-like beta-propeller repeat protein [Gemmatimonadales bacterium]|nr:PQQ-binding-like beta-propeller repeat protein [Gemmatimonadales bacterium]
MLVGPLVVACAFLAAAQAPGCRSSVPSTSGSGGGGGGGGGGTSQHDWPRFGYDAGRSSAPAASMGVTSSNVDSVTRQQVTLDGTVDASAIYLHGVTVKGATHNTFFVTTTYGKTIAIDADSGAILWEFTPGGYTGWAGSAQITTATPVADPDRAHIYAASPEGVVRRLAVADGSVGWTTSLTNLPTREKLAASLNWWHGRVIATTGGYIGDAPPYQGHVAVLDAASGALLHVWNSLCSDTAGLLTPSHCQQSDAAIWGRAGAVIDTTTGQMYVATGNATWDGVHNWGDAVISLDSLATTMTGNYTPTNTAQLNSTDTDLGSTSPVLLGGGVIAQGGKDGNIRTLVWSSMAGTTAHKGGEAQIVSTPSGTDLFTAPAVWRNGSTTMLVAGDNGGTQAWTLSGTQLTSAWKNGNGGTSPIVVDGMAFVYGPGGGLRVYDAASGNLITTLSCGGGHWNSPIVADGRIALPEGNANDHRTSGVLDIWRIP